LRYNNKYPLLFSSRALSPTWTHHVHIIPISSSNLLCYFRFHARTLSIRGDHHTTELFSSRSFAHASVGSLFRPCRHTAYWRHMMEPRPPNVVVHGHRLPPPPNRVALTPSSVLAMVRAAVATPSSAISRGRSHCLGEHAHERGQPAPEMGAAAMDRSPSSPASAVSGGSGGGPKPNSRGTDLCCQRRAVVLPSMDKDASIGGQ
jgi:hypothetical protein